MRGSINSATNSTKPYFQLGVAIRNGHLHSRMQVLTGVLDYALENPRIRVLFIPIRDGWLPDEPLSARLDGLITVAGQEDHWVVELNRQGLPVIDCEGSFIKALPTVWPGDRHRIAFDFVKDLGRKSVGYLGPGTADRDGLSMGLRFGGEAELQGLGFHEFSDLPQDPALDPACMLAGDVGAGLRKFLENLPKPAAIWCLHDELATLVWRVAEELGIQVPNDLALVGCGDHPCALHGSAGLTTLDLLGSQVGYEAARQLHGHLKGAALLEPTMVHLVQAGAPVIERASTGGCGLGNRGVQRAWRLLEDYPKEGLTVEQMIGVSNISRISFYKEFKKAFGILPGKAIRHSRVRKAKQFLVGSDMSIANVGRSCGFVGESDFTNFFKREVGMPPKAWRARALSSMAGSELPSRSAARDRQSLE
jgi:LacI family transcriptional regulator